ncbi:MAG: UDP-N-acetylglucosamine pyrophosphorylase [Acidobacteria bacterium]|nr:UDP-N-acetylglucosamine pyrophosphorylase [Acidobacteriota bacterium]
MNPSLFTDHGVVLPCPESVEIDNGVSPKNIAAGVVIHSGSRIRGAQTSIGPGCVIGAEAPATVENCQLGRGVLLKGGSFTSATFLDESEMGSGAHVRTGTLLEEQASAAHTVGFKQTILFPYVTAGSLINFCDCLMAGGTCRKNHSEIGSSYVHFNFTPRQDKATASLIGDVPRGVMLDQPPIFLGGQGGLVGPARIAYGTVIAAGSICRKDILAENRLYLPPPPNSGPQYFEQAQYGSIHRSVVNNFIYIGNLRALEAWYRQARKKYMTLDPFGAACWNGALNRIGDGILERIKQLGALAGKMPRSLEIACSRAGFPPELRRQQEYFLKRWPELEQKLRRGTPENTGAKHRDAFLAEWESIDRGISYLEAVARIGPGARAAGSRWLQSVVDCTASMWDWK